MKTLKILGVVLLSVLVVGLSAGLLLNADSSSNSSKSGGVSATKFNSAISEFTEELSEQQSTIDEHDNEIASINSAIETINANNRDFVTVPDPDTEYSFFYRSCGTIKIVALRSGDNYIDFYDSLGQKVSSLTYNLSKNDVLFITFYQNGARASFSKFHDGSDVSMKDYVASSTETLSYVKFANDRELFVSIS